MGKIPKSFSTSKKYLFTKVYPSRGDTIYLGSEWIYKEKVTVPEETLESIPSRYRYRAHRIEAEHIIPASWLLRVNGKKRDSYIQAKELGVSPRKYCYRNDMDYRYAHNDLVNLYPSLGSVNAMRSDKLYSNKASGSILGVLEDDKHCLVTSRVLIPSMEYRGMIARVAKYMTIRHGIVYNSRLTTLFDKWDKLYPVTDEEYRRDEIIYQLQGSSVFNPGLFL